MKKKTIWILLSSLLALALVTGACSSDADEPKDDQPVVEEPDDTPVVTPDPEPEPEPVGPQYGGTITVAFDEEPSWFDDVAGHGVYAYTFMLTNEDLLMGDWGASTQGSGLDEFNYTHYPTPNATAGAIAESWEIVDGSTVVFNIRQGVYFHDKAPTNGREVTAEDVVFSLERLWQTEGGYVFSNYAWDDYMESIEMPDEWTVILHTQPDRAGIMLNIAGNFMGIVPKDYIEEHGNLLEWQDSIGTGPWILEDYTSGLSATFSRNDNYWAFDPNNPQNQLPYADAVTHLYMPDISTRMAAIRTGTIDQARNVTWEDGEQLISDNTDLLYAKALLTTAPSLGWRIDKPELPTYDLDVRIALMYAIDHVALAEGFFNGNAEIIAWPVMPTDDWADTYIALEDLPASVQKQYEYHPEDAIELLAAAGYPDGFDLNIITMAPNVDLLSVVKSDLAKVGVNLIIEVLEQGAMYPELIGKTYAESVAWGLHSYQPFRFIDILDGELSNMSMVNDPIVEALHQATLDAYTDEDARRAMLKDKIPYILEQAFWGQLPMPQTYTVWQPWIKGYGGEIDVGYFNPGNWVTWAWVDQELKAE